MAQLINISVTEFALPSPRIGSIELHSGFAQSAAKGIELHKEIQSIRKELNPDYEAEVSATHAFDFEDYTFIVNGKMDGVFKKELGKNRGKTTIEEIKSSFNVFDLHRRLKDNYHHPYCLQLRTYGYMHWLKTNEMPILTMHLVSSRNNDSQDLDISLDIENYELWLKRRLTELAEEAKRAQKRIDRRIKISGNFAFPFDIPRKGQIELIETIQTNLENPSHMLIQAPTGLGKTVGVLHPTLKEAFSRGQRVIYLTPKNSQHSVAEDAIERFKNTGAAVKSLTLTAKSKMCFKSEPYCNPDYCEFAKDHYTKVSNNDLPNKLRKKRNLTATVISALAEEHQVCPYELQFEMINEVDTVICDYNYAFSPNIDTNRISGNGIGETGQPNLIIDEVHNLPARTMDYYSSSLSITTLEGMLEEIETVPEAYRNKTKRFIKLCILAVKNAGPKDAKKPCRINPPSEDFLRIDSRLRDHLSKYLHSDVTIERGDIIMKLANYWSEFTSALEFIKTEPKEFFTTYNPDPPTIKITCCDAAEMMKENYSQYRNVVGFSATLKPFDYYSKLSGLLSEELITQEFTSPFPIENRKILIIPQISSKYAERERNYPRIVEVINKITKLKKGNYFVFFPSFEFLERTFKLFFPVDGYYALRQERKMTPEKITIILDKLKEKSKAHIVFAVQGGIFSEGVDYPGDMIIGAFIVGPPLPNFDLEREQMKNYYDTTYQAGFDYAYTYPAMAKAIQAAGRVIRSETDKGIIILMDNRFLHPNYVKCMPDDWFLHPMDAVSNSILKDIADFWFEKSTDEIGVVI